MDSRSDFIERPGTDRHWYDLFSRGARDWLRHNDKVRSAVREKLPELIAGSDVLPSADSTVQVPVRFLEHSRFRLRDTGEGRGVGQGDGKPGDVLASPADRDPGKGAGGDDEGGYQFVLELKIDDIVDWLWEELKLPNLKVKSGAMRHDDYHREGWSRRGVRSRLDRRRSLKEAIKRRAIQRDAPAFTNDDLRYRQLAVRHRPATEAVVFFAMDVSSSMTERDRRLAKTFFFWVVQGLRRQYTHIEPVFIAHTIEAWEFAEAEFFQVTGSGGTVASSAFRKISEVAAQRYDPGRFNIYVFYASDGANFRHDRETAQAALAELGEIVNYIGYVETASAAQQALSSETSMLFEQLEAEIGVSGRYGLSTPESVWDAIRGFFSQQSSQQAEV
ncbi:MAG TPA: DUF444 family protein [Gammaproteobacteria bacterium]|nr:DUF444 family protein [Gammaproteobacteria bacterium]